MLLSTRSQLLWKHSWKYLSLCQKATFILQAKWWIPLTLVSVNGGDAKFLVRQELTGWEYVFDRKRSVFETADVEILWKQPGVPTSLNHLFCLSCLTIHVPMQLCVAMECVLMGASVGKDPPSSATVLWGSLDPAASTVSRNITAFYIYDLFFPLFFLVFLMGFSLHCSWS